MLSQDSADYVDKYKQLKGSKEPTVRTDKAGNNVFQVPGQAVTIAPLLHVNPGSGCVVVDVYFDSAGNPRLRGALYVGLNQTASYTPRDLDSCWLVDLPDGYLTDREKVRDAIATFEGDGLPPGPPPW